MDEAFGRRAATVAALADPLRRALYRFVAEQPGAVSRDQAAEGVEVPRHTAKFHLDRLVDEGLLVAEFRRLTGRTGPGAGRPAKLYRRARKEVSVSLPSRRYDLAGQVLADAVERALDGTPMAAALDDAAEAAARTVATSYSDAPSVTETLSRLGYEPRDEDGVRLGNCPYDRLAADHAELVCSVNHRFVASLCSVLGSDDRVRRTATGPGPRGCCVRIETKDPAATP
ncbi:helix-turn-helix transcriptional regulator [Nocardioides antri]|uniref:Helix-turn-helix domain-containing protein n=1 Tax=Nocardioides antri TaxID=2607659 RepID=A0A5B1M0Z0_9ACTN|nr:helix-turn-helix domain-containing protein [Nocardioides antri]KAA1426424.1 helix-turn-helix domain-containing protein [Nocardioides antri]